MSNALYVGETKWNAQLELTGQPVQHVRSLRLRIGDQLLLLDGKGTICYSVIEKIKKRSVEVKVIDSKFVSSPKCQPIMAIAISKAVRRGFFLEKASELGAWEIWLWQAERSMGKVSEDMIEHCRGKLIAGCEQSQNPWLPRLRAFKNASEVCDAAREADWRIIPWEDQTTDSILALDQLGREGKTIFAIGPEGGYTNEELEIFKNSDFTAVSLGKRVLRCETAAVLCLGLQWWASQLTNN